MRPLPLALPLAFLAALLAPDLPAAEAPAPAAVPVESFELANGMRFLVVERPERVTVAAGWVARVGSADEAPGRTGITHLVEHMLFKGTETIGARDFERERALIEEQDRLAAEIRRLHRRQRERFRAGEIGDPYAAEARSPELVELDRRFAETVERHRALTVPGEFGRLYAEAGGQGLNALTLQDMTLYTVNLPAEKLELWFWMEADRLLHPVLRELYREREVVREERRQRTESTPTGPFDEELKALFWQSHPYGWPVLGWPSDLEALDRADARAHLAAYFSPGNLTAALVGPVTAERVRPLAERYFGRLEPSAAPAPDVVTLEEPQRAERRMVARCDCRPRAQVLYHTVPFVHPDSAPLEILAGLLNGRTGRLHRSLVLEQGIASSAYALQSAQRWAGAFVFTADAKGGATPEDQVAAWERELDRLRREPIPEREIEKIRNQVTADAYRRLREPSALVMQLLMSDGFGGWRLGVDGGARALAVTAEDVRRVVRGYFAPEGRTVGLYERRPSPAGAARQGEDAGR